jgi:hypothetical protein
MWSDFISIKIKNNKIIFYCLKFKKYVIYSKTVLTILINIMTDGPIDEGQISGGIPPEILAQAGKGDPNATGNALTDAHQNDADNPTDTQKQESIPKSVDDLIEKNQRYIDYVNKLCERYSKEIARSSDDDNLTDMAANLGKVLTFTAQINKEAQEEYYRIQRKQIIDSEIERLKSDPDETRTKDDIRAELEEDEDFMEEINNKVEDGLRDLVGAAARGIIESDDIFRKVMENDNLADEEREEIDEFLNKSQNKANDAETQLSGKENVEFLRDFVISTKKKDAEVPLAMPEDEFKELERTHGGEAGVEGKIKKVDGMPPQALLLPITNLAPLLASLLPFGQLIYIAVLVAGAKLLPKFTPQHKRAASIKKEPPPPEDDTMGFEQKRVEDTGIMGTDNKAELPGESSMGTDSKGSLESLKKVKTGNSTEPPEPKSEASAKSGTEQEEVKKTKQETSKVEPKPQSHVERIAAQRNKQTPREQVL